MKLFATAYAPPLTYLRELNQENVVQMEVHEHFVKQTLRNRTHILSPNGVQALIIPVKHENRTKTAVKDLKISNDSNWQRQHWRSLDAAYRRSAFFEFYADDLAPFYEKEYTYLHDFNAAVLDWLLGVYKINIQITGNSSYEKELPASETDYRTLCDTGVPQLNHSEKSYPQVFSYKESFTPGLSAYDLVFNMGPACNSYL
ncbi:MAG: WbqC-like protein family protein [Bacteroidetes bacterium ADurb.Bin397]|nr:MAG: WbqC-like protein family protein [Bacteroidetes bacterium ADurb.Bin397]